MEIQFFKVRATLERCDKYDLMDKDGYFKENKSIFFKDLFKQKFTGFYKIPSDYPFMMKDSNYYSTKLYWLEEISSLLAYDQLYKLSSTHRELDFHFLLIVKNAKKDDFFDVLNNLKLNLQYYIKSDDGISFIGPYTIDQEVKESKILELIEKRKIFVLSSKQTFEPYVRQQSA